MAKRSAWTERAYCKTTTSLRSPIPLIRVSKFYCCNPSKNPHLLYIFGSLFLAFVFKDLSPNEAIGLPSEITETYYINRKLGSGAYGLVRLVYERRTCEQFAMKIVKKNMLEVSAHPNMNHNDPVRVLNEAKIMKNLSHPCVVRMHDIVDKPDSVYMVLEFMRGGDLLNRIISKKLLSEDTAKLYFYQMCHAVKYLHDKGRSTNYYSFSRILRN